MGCWCVIVTCTLTMVRNATSSRAGDLTRSSYVHFCDSDQQSVHRFSQECFQRRSQGFQRVTMPRLCPPILTRTGMHTLLRHYLRVSTFHRSIVIDLYAGNPSQHRQLQGAKSKIFEMCIRHNTIELYTFRCIPCFLMRIRNIGIRHSTRS